MRRLTTLLVWFFIFQLNSVVGIAWAAQNTEVKQSIDSIHIQPETNELVISGWVWDPRTQKSAQQINIRANHQVYESPQLRRLERQDVQSTLGIPLLETGFEVRQVLQGNAQALKDMADSKVKCNTLRINERGWSAGGY